MIEVALVPPTEVEKREPLLRPLVERMNDVVPGQWTWDYVRDEAQAESLHLWVAMQDRLLLMLVGCMPYTAPGGRLFYDVMFAAGCEVAAVFTPMMDEFDRFAAHCGATVRIPIGRPGWSKLMRARGMKITGYCYEAG